MRWQPVMLQIKYYLKSEWQPMKFNCVHRTYLSPLLFGTENVGDFSLHSSHLASSKRFPLTSRSTRNDTLYSFTHA